MCACTRAGRGGRARGRRASCSSFANTVDLKRIGCKSAAIAAGLLLATAAACAPAREAGTPPVATQKTTQSESVRVLDLYPGVTATIVAPGRLDTSKRIDLILYALPNGNTTAETIGRKLADGIGWRFDIQHIGAQTRALRTRGIGQAVVVYLEANTKSWPEWRRVHGYDRANARIVSIVEQVRAALGHPPHLAIALTGHSGGGSFAWGFMDGQGALPASLERIALLDSNYSFEPRHGAKIREWLRSNPRNTLVVLAYDDREIMLDGKKVVSDSGGTWRASQRMIEYLRASQTLAHDTLGEFLRYHAPQIEILLHPNPGNRILHTAMIGEMNGYMHALLVRRPQYKQTVLKTERKYTQFIQDDVVLPAAAPPEIPARSATALTGSAFIASIATLPREEREAAVLRELMAGNIPAFLRTFQTVNAGTIAYDVMPDYLAIGSDEDYVRMPMNPYTAQAFCDAFGFVLPTRKMVNDIWSAATVRVEPKPLTQERESAVTFLEHHRIIETQLAAHERGGMRAGMKKDVVVSNKLMERPQRVAIYGWHYLNGEPIQPLYSGHVDWYVDYSHGIRPVRRIMHVEGVARRFEEIVKEAELHHLLSDEGPIANPRYNQ